MRFGQRPKTFLDTLSPDQVADLRARGNAKRYKKNATIYRSGDKPEALFLVLRGRVRLQDRDDSGRERTVAFAAAGEPFGLESVGESSPRTLRAIAAEDSELLAIERNGLRALLRRDSLMTRKLLHYFAALNAHANERVKLLAFLDVPSRLTGTLLWLADRFGMAVPDGTEIPYWFTHQELADLIGSTRETVTTVLAEFRRNELLTTRNHHFIILDRPAILEHVGLPEFGPPRDQTVNTPSELA